jgi:hypothetical protein
MSGVLKFELPNQILVMPARGKVWSDRYVCLSKGLAHISNRTPSDGIGLGVWKGELAIGRSRLKIEPISLQSENLSEEK